MQEILEKITQWIKTQPEIKVALMTGSNTQTNAVVDAVSDLDIAIFGDDLEIYCASNDWMTEISEVWVCLPLTTDQGYPTRLVIFDQGRKVDFSFWPLKELEVLSVSDQLPDIYARGYQVLEDKLGISKKFVTSNLRALPTIKPSEKEFVALVEEFWFEIWHVAKYLYRNDLWHAKFRDWTTKELLLRVIEWSEKSSKGWDYDTRYLGVKMNKWISSQTWLDLEEAFGKFTQTDSWNAMFKSAELFSKLAQKVAANCNYQYPQSVEDNILGFCKNLRSRQF